MGDVRTSDIIRQVEAVQGRITKLKKDITNKNVIACLGNTRSGKSTLINFLLGVDLTSIAEGKRFLISSDSNGNGPCIKHGCTSHTKFPSIWKSETNSSIIIVDFPGLDDNRGAVRNIINILFMNQLRHATSVKFVVVSDIKDLVNDNINEFTELMTDLESIIIDFSAVSLIFTKAAEHITVASICSLLQKKILDVDELAVKKDLVTHLTENRRQIGVLRAPLKRGLIRPADIECNVKSILTNNNFTREVYLFILPTSTHCTLLDLYHKSFKELDFEIEIKRLIRPLEKYFDIDKYVFASTDQELETTLRTSTLLLQKINTERAAGFKTLTCLYASVSTLIEDLSEDFEIRLNFLKFMDELSLLDKKIQLLIINRYGYILSTLSEKIAKLMEKIMSEVASRLQEGLKQVVNYVKEDYDKVIVIAAVYIPIVKKALEALGQDVGWISWEVAKVSGATFGIGLLGVASFGTGAYAVHYYNTISLRKKLRKQQGRS